MVFAPTGGSGQGGPGGRGGLGQINYEGAAALRPEDLAPLRRVFDLFGPYRRGVMAILGAVILGAALGVLPPLLLKVIIDDALPAGDRGELALLCLAMIGLGLAAAGVQVLQQWLSLRIGQAVMHDLRTNLYARVQAMPFAFFTRTRTGEVMSRVLGDVRAAQDVVTRLILNATQNVLTVAVTVAVMLALNWRLALASVIALPLFIIPVRRAGRIRARLTRQTQAKIADVSAELQESLGVDGVLLMKTFGRQPEELRRFAQASTDLRDLQVRQDLAGRWFQAFVGLFGSISPAIVLWYGGYEVTRDALTVGEIVAFTAYIARLYTPVSQLVSVQVDVLASRGVFGRIFDYLDLDPGLRDPPGAVAPPPAAGAITFDRVTFSYDGRRNALEEVSFDLISGQMTALVGPSGAGKTTVTYLIPRLYDANAGAVRIDGHDLRDVPGAWITDQIAVVPQETFLFHASVADNIRFASPAAADEDVAAAARAANIHDVIAALPEGYGTIVGERGFRLSGGERQRVAIARALLKNPRIILLDEATSALDSRSERAVQEALDRLLEGRTSVVIAHRLSTVIAADRILAFAGGRLVESGTHTDLLARDGLYAQLYREQYQHHPDTPREDHHL